MAAASGSGPGGGSRQSKLGRLLGASQQDARREEWLSSVLRVLEGVPVRAMACGGPAVGALLLLESGHVFALARHAVAPRQVLFAGMASDDRVEGIAAGSDHLAARTGAFTRNLYTWGRNDRGQLGLGHRRPESEPRVVAGIDEQVLSVSCGNAMTICQTEDGLVYAWGQGQGQGQGQAQPHGRGRGQRAKFANAASSLADLLVPAPVPALGRAASRARRSPDEGAEGAELGALRVDCRGAQAVAWTRAGRQQGGRSGDEAARLQLLVDGKRAQLRDVHVRLACALEMWPGAPRACAAAAELAQSPELTETADLAGMAEPTETLGARGTLGVGEVRRDAGLEALDARLEQTQRLLRRERAAVGSLAKDAAATLGALADAETEIADLKQGNLHVRRRVASLRRERSDRATALDRAAERLGSRLATDALIDRRDELVRALRLDDEALAALAQQTLEFNQSRKALEERAADLRARSAVLAKGRARVDLRMLRIDVRARSYARMRLRRQQRLQQRFQICSKDHWRECLRVVHAVWRAHVLPADVFVLLEDIQRRAGPLSAGNLSAGPLSAGPAMASVASVASGASEASGEVAENRPGAALTGLDVRALVRAATDASNAALDAADESAVGALEALRRRRPQLEQARQLRSASAASGGPASGGPASGGPASVTLRAGQGTVLTRVAFDVLVSPSRDSLDLFLGELTIMVDGCGEAGRGFLSQHLRGVVFEDAGRLPARAVPGAVTASARVLQGARPHELRLRFPVPVRLEPSGSGSAGSGSATVGVAHCWLGVVSDKPNGVVRLLGSPTSAAAAASSSSSASASPSLLFSSSALSVAGDGRAGDGSGRANAGGFSEVPVVIAATAHVLTPCERALRVVRHTIDERRAINTLVRSADSVHALRTLAKELRSTSTRKPIPFPG